MYSICIDVYVDISCWQVLHLPLVMLTSRLAVHSKSIISQRKKSLFINIFYLLTKTFIFLFCLVHPWTALVHLLYRLYEHARTGQVFSSCWDLNLGHLHISAKHDNTLHLNTELGPIRTCLTQHNRIYLQSIPYIRPEAKIIAKFCFKGQIM